MPAHLFQNRRYAMVLKRERLTFGKEMMKPIDTFSTRRNLLSTVLVSAQLLSGGEYTGKRIPGYDIRAQYQIDDRYLLITDCDCPFEETTYFILLDSNLKRLARKRRDICAMDFEPLGENQVRMRSGGPYELTVTVHREKSCLVRGLLTITEEQITEHHNPA